MSETTKSTSSGSIYMAGVMVALGMSLMLIPEGWNKNEAIIAVLCASFLSWLFVGFVLGLVARMVFEAAGVSIL